MRPTKSKKVLGTTKSKLLFISMNRERSSTMKNKLTQARKTNKNPVKKNYSRLENKITKGKNHVAMSLVGQILSSIHQNDPQSVLNKFC